MLDAVPTLAAAEALPVPDYGDGGMNVEQAAGDVAPVNAQRVQTPGNAVNTDDESREPTQTWAREMVDDGSDDGMRYDEDDEKEAQEDVDDDAHERASGTSVDVAGAVTAAAAAAAAAADDDDAATPAAVQRAPKRQRRRGDISCARRAYERTGALTCLFSCRRTDCRCARQRLERAQTAH
jgi:hypothetical protein